MHSADRLHALDAVRAFALLLGIVLHAAYPYLEGGKFWATTETPSATLAAVWYTIHMFRMPLFFLIAGYFGRMLLERRGLAGFIGDRSRRIVLPLLVGFPLVMLVTGGAYFLGALVAGADLRPLKPPPPAQPQSILASINLIHLWFLYYLALFHGGALALRGVLARNARLHAAIDAALRFLMRGTWGSLLLALPIAAYYFQLEGWSSWTGFPAAFSLVPDPGALLAYGLFFAVGWLLHRQQPLLLSLEKRWPLYGTLAIAAWVVCRAIGGARPHWGPYLQGGQLLAYSVSYMAGAWSWTFALIGAALRFLSDYSPVRRYLADSSYWVYLMHVAALFFFAQVLHPLPLHWSLKYLLTVAASVPVLLLSYHYLVRFTFIGATLNGRRLIRSLPVQKAASGSRP